MRHFCIINYFIKFSNNWLPLPSSLGEETAISPMGDEAHYLLEGEVEYQLDKQTKASSIDVSKLTRI